MPSFEIENSYDNCVVAGIDEAGRGPLCGPVFASCCVVNKNYYPADVNDSKKLTESKREKIFEDILKLESEKKLLFGIGTASVDEIEKLNIRNATKLAMKRSYIDLLEKYNNVKIDVIIVDGNFVPDVNVKSDYVIKGDQKSISIATASIIAKVSRDRLLRKIDSEFPCYNWKKNKGYGTKEHMEAIKKYGICKYHRKSFIHTDLFGII